MESAAMAMTLDFGINYFNAIFLNKQLKLISSNGMIITIPDGNQKTLTEQTGQALDKLIEFFKQN